MDGFVSIDSCQVNVGNSSNITTHCVTADAVSGDRKPHPSVDTSSDEVWSSVIIIMMCSITTRLRIRWMGAAAAA